MKKFIATVMALGIVGGALPAACPFAVETSAADDIFDPPVINDPLSSIGTPLPDYPERLLGDADKDGYISPYDASRTLNHLAMLSIGKTDAVSDETAAAMDTDPDGRIGASDAAHILRWCIKKPANAESDYKKSVISGHQNKEIAYDASSFINSSRYVDPSDSAVKPEITIDKVEKDASDAAGRQVKVNINLSGADLHYASAGFHLIYDDRLTLDNLKQPSDFYDSLIFSHGSIDKGNEFIGITDYENDSPDGILATATFTLPEDAESGDLYPIGIQYCEDERTFDCFGGVVNNAESQLMNSALFTNGISNGYISLVEFPTVPITEPQTAEYDIITESGITYYVYPSGSARVVDCAEDITGEVVIPDSINDVTVTHIDEAAFQGCSGITSVKIPVSVKNIAENAFSGCPLEKVTIINYNCTITGSDTFGDAEIHSYVGGSVEQWAKDNGKVFVPMSDVATIHDPTLKGDANLDDQVNIADAVLVMQVATNPDKYAPGKSDVSIKAQGEINADVDGKAGLTNSDALLIQKFKLGLIKSFD